MDNAQLIQQVKDAREQARSWPETGWTMQFGPYQDAVNNLKAAQEAKDTLHNRQDALAYWTGIQYASDETIVQADKALAALEKGDVNGAMRAVYFAVFVEKKFNEAAPTWGPVLQALKQ